MTGQFPRFREFKEAYNRHTCSGVNPTTGEVQKNFNGICINNSIGCLDWKVGDWFREETEVLLLFLDNMKREMAEQNLPAPAKNQNLKEIEAPMVANVKGAAPSVGLGHSTGKGTGFRMELTPDSWNQLKEAARDPVVFLTHPRNLVKYQKVSVTNTTSSSALQHLLKPGK